MGPADRTDRVDRQHDGDSPDNRHLPEPALSPGEHRRMDRAAAEQYEEVRSHELRHALVAQGRYVRDSRSLLASGPAGSRCRQSYRSPSLRQEPNVAVDTQRAGVPAAPPVDGPRQLVYNRLVASALQTPNLEETMSVKIVPVLASFLLSALVLGTPSAAPGQDSSKANHPVRAVERSGSVSDDRCSRS